MFKVFITLWLWYVILSIITLANVTNWIFSLINPICGEHFIFNHLEMSGGDTFMSQTGKDLPGFPAYQ